MKDLINILTSHKVNQYSKKLGKVKSSLYKFGRRAVKPIQDLQTGFIHHPAGFPIEYKRVWFADHYDYIDEEPGNIGVIFDSDRYIKPGAFLEITIPLRNEIEKFRGKVVLVRNFGDHFEIGIWFCCRADASRARIVEQICHIETYIQEKKYRDGPYALNRDRVAQEWIINNASNVPSL